eukprot:22707-Chlamydomonas_euryale.AAC.7
MRATSASACRSKSWFCATGWDIWVRAQAGSGWAVGLWCNADASPAFQSQGGRTPSGRLLEPSGTAWNPLQTPVESLERWSCEQQPPPPLMSP